MMKRILTLVLGFCLITCFCTGCGNASNVTETIQKSTTEASEDQQENNNKTEEKKPIKPQIVDESSDDNEVVADKQTKDKSKQISDSTQSLPKEDSESDTNPPDSEQSMGNDENLNKEKTIEAYVLDFDENHIYVDTENSEGRTYPNEGDDRAVEFDISNAEIDAPGRLKVGLTVTIKSEVHDGINMASYIYSDGDEKEPIF